MAAYIDRIFRGYGEEFFGKEVMDKITDEQVEEARCAAFWLLSKVTASYGKMPKGIEKRMFCDYLTQFTEKEKV